MRTKTTIARRSFIKLTAASGAMLAIGYMPSSAKDPQLVNLLEAADGPIQLNPYIFIKASGQITLFNHRAEMGQGTFQSIPMIIAEELEVDLDKVTIEQSPANRDLYGDQMTVGSRSIQNNYALMRKVGAAAKDMLIRAAAETWTASTDDCYAEHATIVHKPTGRKLTYGELVEKASKLTPSDNPKLKDPANFHTLGKSLKRRDVPMKVNGEAKFGMDFSVPGMLYASVAHSSVFLGKVVSFDADKALAIPGVKHVFKTQREVFGRPREAVAVVADSWWAADEGRKALSIVWDAQGLEAWNTEKIFEDYRKASGEAGEVFKQVGNFDDVFQGGKTKVEASYETPYQAHACMEPMNATVHVQAGACDYWGSTQHPNGAKTFLAKFCGLSEDKVNIHYTFMGGGFGRRSMTDVLEEAADLSKKTGAPIKVIWTREDDIGQGPFRACSLNMCRGAVDGNGNVAALEHKVICQEIGNQSGDNMKAGRQITGGINTEYAIPNVRINGVLRKNHVPITYWRSVYHSTNCFAHESFMDELAIAAGKDPLVFRLSMLKEHPRYTNVLNIVAERSGWKEPRKKDTGMGVAIVERSGAFVAMVVEIARVGGKVKIKKVTSAIDCGTTVNPDIVRAQTEGSIVMGITSACKSEITIQNGAAVETNFHKYEMLKLGECPEIEVTVVESTEKPEGAGEGGLPPLAPALANAIFNLTKKRIRKLPIRLEDV